MPDLRPAQTFAREMTQLEQEYLWELDSYLKNTRRAILDELVGNGINNPQLPALARRELDSLRRDLEHLARNKALSIDYISAGQVDRLLKSLRRVRPAAPGLDDLQASTQTSRRAILGGLVDNLVGLVDEIQARLTGELGRLRSSNTPTEAAVDRLLASDVADGRVSVWRNAGNIVATESQVDLWTAGTSIVSNYLDAGQSQAGERWKKQCIAAIDERTTDCCLQAHGQIVDLDAPFKLTGEPRFSDEQQNPPFHWYCRTATSLWVEEFEQVGTTTADMRDAARAEITARQDGSRVEIHPAHATSRR
jgi:hypothetical protein